MYQRTPDLVERRRDGHCLEQGTRAVEGRRSPLRWSRHIRAHAVVGGKGARVVEQRILLRVARRQQDGLWRAAPMADSIEIAREPHDLSLVVDHGAPRL